MKSLNPTLINVIPIGDLGEKWWQTQTNADVASAQSFLQDGLPGAASDARCNLHVMAVCDVNLKRVVAGLTIVRMLEEGARDKTERSASRPAIGGRVGYMGRIISCK
jgi:hypothetical protein